MYSTRTVDHDKIALQWVIKRRDQKSRKTRASAEPWFLLYFTNVLLTRDTSLPSRHRTPIRPFFLLPFQFDHDHDEDDALNYYRQLIRSNKFRFQQQTQNHHATRSRGSTTPTRRSLHPRRVETIRWFGSFEAYLCLYQRYVNVRRRRLLHNNRFFFCYGIGTIFDVSAKSEIYGPGKSYGVFAGKDGSKGLGMSSLDPKDAIPDYSELSPSDMGVLNDWHAFFTYVVLWFFFLSLPYR